MKKSRTRKPSRRAAKPAAAKTARPIAPLIWAAVAAVAVIALLIALFTRGTEQGALVTVNGEEITDTDVDFQYNLLPESYRSIFTRDQIIEQIIDETLIVQAAERAGIEVTQADVHARVQEILESNGMTITELQENLANLNVTQEDFESLVRRQLVISSYVDSELGIAEPDNETLQAMYALSQDEFTTPDQVTVRHVLISSQRDNAAILAKEVYDAVRAGADFCAYAQNTSDDRGSRETCGMYTFPRNFMVPEFEQASFEMQPGEFRLIQTTFGYHVIEKIADVPAAVKTFEEVRDRLVEQYRSAERSAAYRKMIARLRDQATIAYANGTVLMPVKPTTLEPAPESPAESEIPAELEIPSEPEVPAEPVPESPADEAVEQPAPEVPATETPAPEIPAPTTPDTAPTPEPVDSNLFACIAKKSIVYGTEWSSDTRAARVLFARQGVALPYVACDRYPETCADIAGYPTWKIDGQLYAGRMSLEQLKDAANC